MAEHPVAAPAAALPPAIQAVPSLHWTEGGDLRGVTEPLAVEAALSLEVAYRRGENAVIKTLGITMRTPGADTELALGFLLGEGVIADADDVQSLETLPHNAAGETIDTVRVTLARAPRNNLSRVSRAITTTSACGLCGRATLEGLPTAAAPAAEGENLPRVAGRILAELPDRLRRTQSIFAETGGCHGAALADARGELLLSREDVGRHNAVDKLLGAALQQSLAVHRSILVLSGRASFELVQKAAAAGVPLIVAVGAPSSAAAELAHAAGITLVGFTRGNRFNVYTHAAQVDLA